MRLSYFGVDVQFPYDEIYPSQKAIIANSIRAYRNRENALLESPTGTGKSIALLSGALAYQHSLAISNNTGSLCSLPVGDASESRVGIYSAPLAGNDSAFSSQDPTESLPQIWYTTRTHGQLKQLVSEYRKLPYSCQMAILASRKHLCLNSKVAKSTDPNARCQQEVDAGKCPYVMKSTIPAEFHPNGEFGKYDIEDLRTYGQREMRCPYHLSLVILSKAKLIFSPYNHVLDPRVKSQQDTSLIGNILIIDEAHNIEGACRESGSFRYRKSNFVFTLAMLKKLNENADDVSENEAFAIVSESLTLIMNWFTSLAKGLRFSRVKEKAEDSMQNVLANWNVTFQTWPRLHASLIKTINKRLNRRHALPAEALDLLEHFSLILSIAMDNNMQRCGDFQVAVVTGETEEEDVLMCLCLNPSAIFRYVSREARSIVVSSGTLSPLTTFSSELGTSFPITLSAPHVIGKDQVSAFVLTNALDGTILNSAYAHLQMHQRDVMIGLGKVFEALLPMIPDGVLFFVPSYPLLKNMIATWKSSGLWDTLRDIKPIFCEEQDGKETVHDKYIDSISKHKGGLLIGVFRGKMSEGIDFVDEQARAVFVFGIPYPPFNNIEIVAKKKYNDESTGLISGDEWYQSQALRSLFQAVGRCIRHTKDYGTVILMDSRLPALVPKFPTWLRQSFRSNIGVSDIREQLNEFFVQMRQKLPKVVKWEAGASIVYACSNCKARVIDIQHIEVTESVRVERPGFMRLLEVDSDPDCIFVPHTTRRVLDVNIISKDHFMPEDRTAYNVVMCKCGCPLGARVRAAQSCDKEYINGLLLLLSRVFPLTPEFPSKPRRKPRERVRKEKEKKKEKKKDPMAGQMKLFFG